MNYVYLKLFIDCQTFLKEAAVLKKEKAYVFLFPTAILFYSNEKVHICLYFVA